MIGVSDLPAGSAPCKDSATYHYDAKGVVATTAVVPNGKVWELASPALHTLTVFLQGSSTRADADADPNTQRALATAAVVRCLCLTIFHLFNPHFLIQAVV